MPGSDDARQRRGALAGIRSVSSPGLSATQGIRMKCPRCKAPDRLPTMIEELLPAMGCGSCHGSLVSLLHYRYWAENQKPSSSPPPGSSAIPDATDTASAIRCPKCDR